MNLHTQWYQRYDSFKEQVEQFNTIVATPALSDEKIDDIYTIVKREVNRLSELNIEITKREEELNKQEFCCTPVSLSKALQNLTILYTISKVCTIAATAIVAFEGENVPLIIGGWTIFAVAQFFDGAGAVYGTNLQYKREEASELAKLNKEGLEHAKIFKEFLKQLRKIRKLETQLLKSHQGNPSLADREIIDMGSSKDLDRRISICLKEYEELPSRYRPDDVYCRLISLLIQRLPPNDPLYIGLNKLDFLTPLNVTHVAELALPVHYLPSQDKVDDDRWNAESDRYRNDAELHTLDRTSENEAIDDSMNMSDLQEEIARYKNLVLQRFHLRHNIAFFETLQGNTIYSQNGEELHTPENDSSDEESDEKIEQHVQARSEEMV